MGMILVTSKDKDMESLIDLGLAILPAVLVFMTAWLLFDKYLSRIEFPAVQSTNNLEAERLRIMLPLQLKAYERLIIFMERIDPSAMVMRISQSGMSSIQLQLEFLKAVREEFEHNQSLQIYVSPQCWAKIVHAKNEVNGLIKIAAEKTSQADASGAELARIILQIESKVQETPVKQAIAQLNKEARQLSGVV